MEAHASLVYAFGNYEYVLGNRMLLHEFKETNDIKNMSLAQMTELFKKEFLRHISEKKANMNVFMKHNGHSWNWTSFLLCYWAATILLPNQNIQWHSFAMGTVIRNILSQTGETLNGRDSQILEVIADYLSPSSLIVKKGDYILVTDPLGTSHLLHKIKNKYRLVHAPYHAVYKELKLMQQLVQQ